MNAKVNILLVEHPLFGGGTGVPPVRCREAGWFQNRNTRAGRPCHYSEPT
jgi:hypothetical protein